MTEKEKGINYEIEVAKQAGANMLLPSTHIEGLSEFHAPVLERVLLSSNPDDGDVYAHDNASAGPRKKWRPTKQALMKLSVCAGVIWSTSETRRIDNGADRNYIAYKAVGGIRKADGQPVFFSGEYDLDFEVMEEELRESYEKKAAYLKKGDSPNLRPATAQEKAEYIDYCVKRDLLQKRKFKLRLCEAGAMNRVLRMLLGIKQAYTTEELAKPFVMARIVFRPDFSDKSVRDKFIDASIKAMTGIYGADAAARVPEKAEPIDVTPIEVEDVGDAEPEGTPYKMDAEKQPFVQEPEPEPAGQPEDSGIFDFTNSDVDAQVKTIAALAKKADYNLDSWLKKAKLPSVAGLSPEKRLDLFKHLRDRLAAIQHDGIPF